MTIRHPVSMILAGTVVGFLSGLRMPEVFGVRGALFGFTLSLTCWWIHKKGWHWNKVIPGIILGLILGLNYGSEVISFDFRSLINCTLFIPGYAYCYLQKNFFHMLWKLLPAGLTCTLIRIYPGGMEFFYSYFVEGTLFFLAMWLVVMWLTDPRFIREKKTKTITEEPA